jgi:hypothetical protein
MRQKAVSSAPQNDEPNQMLATSAITPKLVEFSRTRESVSAIVVSVASGNSSRRSASTLSSMSGDWSTLPATNRATRASGNSESRRLYATMPDRPVTLSS